MFNQFDLFTEVYHNYMLRTCHCKLILSYRFVQNQRLMRFYNKSFLSILTAFPPLTNHAILYDVYTVKLQLYANEIVW